MKIVLYNVVIMLSLLSFNLHAQRLSISVYQVVNNAHVTYKTANATIDFNNHDIINQFEILAHKRWFEYLPLERRQRFGEAISRLVAGNSIAVSENESSAIYDSAIHELIKEVLGADLLRAGNARVLNRKKQIQSTIQYQPSSTTSEEAIYDFYFDGDRSPFFSAQAMNELSRAELVVDPLDDAAVFEDASAEVVAQEDENKIYNVVEEQPTYPGGMDRFNEYIAKNLKYPKNSMVEGNVFVSFVVEKDGSLSDISVLKGLEESFDKEAMRLIRESGIWVPGKLNQNVQRVRFIYLVKFKRTAEK